MKQQIKTAVHHNLPILLFGKSGWGKTEIVEQVGKELGLDVVTLSLALCLPEDVGGIPQAEGDSFKYLMPKWFYDRQDTPFILFLDEINQAPPQVLHAIYGLVQKRELHGYTNSEMRVVAAGNMADENPQLTEIMQPLLNRFYIMDFIHDPNPAIEYLNATYKLDLKELEKSPRDTEQGIIAYRAGLKGLAISKAGMSVIKHIEKGKNSKADTLIQSVKMKEIQDRNGFI